MNFTHWNCQTLKTFFQLQMMSRLSFLFLFLCFVIQQEAVGVNGCCGCDEVILRFQNTLGKYQ